MFNFDLKNPLCYYSWCSFQVHQLNLMPQRYQYLPPHYHLEIFNLNPFLHPHLHHRYYYFYEILFSSSLFSRFLHRPKLPHQSILPHLLLLLHYLHFQNHLDFRDRNLRHYHLNLISLYCHQFISCCFLHYLELTYHQPKYLYYYY